MTAHLFEGAPLEKGAGKKFCCSGNPFVVLCPKCGYQKPGKGILEIPLERHVRSERTKEDINQAWAHWTPEQREIYKYWLELAKEFGTYSEELAPAIFAFDRVCDFTDFGTSTYGGYLRSMQGVLSDG